MAFAGAYRWTTVPLCAGVALMLAVTRPAIARRPARVLDGGLLLCLLAVAGQLVPLPAQALDRVSPRAFDVSRVAALTAAPATRGAQPLSVDPESTAWAFALGAAYVGLFWCARAVFARGGVRTTVRGIAWLGLALTTLVAVQRATSPKLLFWYWQPMTPGATPYGPFVNRNNLATWLAMAVPLLIGYAMARYQSRQHADGASPAAGLDSTQLWLGGSAVLLTGGLIASLSRAGMIGGAIGLMTFVLFSARRIRRGGGVVWMLAAVGVMVLLASWYADLGKLAVRLQETTEMGAWGRPVIWRDTWHMTADFWLTGVGAGAFQRAMLVYQEGSRLFFFNHAHNEYLQLAAEGGALVAIPAAVALLAAIARMAHLLGTDHTAMFWVRAGAMSGMVAAAVQGIWDTGLRTPADGVLFAVIAAVALHEPRARSAGSSGRRHTSGSPSPERDRSARSRFRSTPA